LTDDYIINISYTCISCSDRNVPAKWDFYLSKLFHLL
jgi:hypothetical protein